MYHGTSKEAAERIQKEGFKPSEGGMLGKGVYMSSDISKARAYAGGGGVVLEAEVDVGKVKKIDRQHHPQQKTWQGQYDTAWVPPACGMVKSGREESCIKDPHKIELAPRVHIL
jgi:RNA:NAD 2'-phosphotransferase (TPT1/KptA family)